MHDDPIRSALAKSGLIDITTTGRRSGQPRRIEIAYHAFGGRIYISGMPRADRRRDWLANLEARPEFTFHLKKQVVADLPARARIIDDEAERRTVLARVAAAWGRRDLEAMVAHSPLVEVTILQGQAGDRALPAGPTFTMKHGHSGGRPLAQPASRSTARHSA